MPSDLVAVEHQYLPIVISVQVEYDCPLNLKGKTQGLLGLGPPLVKQVVEGLESVSHEEQLLPKLQLPHLYRDKTYLNKIGLLLSHSHIELRL